MANIFRTMFPDGINLTNIQQPTNQFNNQRNYWNEYYERNNNGTPIHMTDQNGSVRTHFLPRRNDNDVQHERNNYMKKRKRYFECVQPRRSKIRQEVPTKEFLFDVLEKVGLD